MMTQHVTKHAPSWASPALPWLCLGFMAAVLTWSSSRLAQVATPAPATHPPHLFSEARARVHLHKLAAEIVDRQVSMPGLALATEYMLQQAEALRARGAARGDGVDVRVVKHTASGAIGMDFVGTNFTNAYRALDVVSLTITPPGTAHLKGLLIAAHHDSAVCSQGASDDAAQSAVMLEAARALLSRPALPPTPVTFLWTGGEEPVSPAAHGWASQSPLYATMGAFINLEAMGGGGLPIVFQHTGSWVLEAYAAGAPRPRGSRVAQDIFDLQLIPADSDFRMFSARHYGALAGLDIAFIVGSTAYHTYLDSPAAVKPGVLQEMGEGLLGGLQSVSRALAARQQPGASLSPDQELDAARARAVYFDIWGYVMVSYSDSLAQKLHNLPAGLLLCFPLVASALGARPIKGGGGGLPLGPAYACMAAGAARAAASLLLALALPIGLGAARTLLSGRPMVWFAAHWVAHAQFVPAAIVGALLPWAGLKRASTASTPLRPGDYMALQLAGSGLTASLVGAALTAAALTGNSIIFVLCGAAGAVSALACVGSASLTPKVAAAIATATLLPLIVGGTAVTTFCGVMIERMSLSGAVHPVVGDTVVAALCGAGVLAATAAVLLPLMASAWSGRAWRRVFIILAAVALGVAAWSAAYQPSYSPNAPKRVMISHLHQTTVAGSSPATAGAAVPPPAGGGVSMQGLGDAVSIAGSDSFFLEKALDLSGFELLAGAAAAAGGRAHTPVYPLDALLRGVLVKTPTVDATTPLIDRAARYTPPGAVPDEGLAEGTYPEPLISHLPFLQLVRTDSAGGSNVTRVHLRLYTQQPCWGVLNITTAAELGAWSFTPRVPSARVCAACGNLRKQVVRFTTQEQNPYWAFWVDVQAPGSAEAAARIMHDSSVSTPAADLWKTRTETAPGEQRPSPLGLRLELSVTYLQRTRVLRRVLALLPNTTAESWLGTVYQSYWTL